MGYHLNIRFPDAMRPQLEAMKKKKDRSFNWIIVQAVREYLARNAEIIQADAQPVSLPQIKPDEDG